MSWANIHPRITASALAGALTSIVIAEAGRHGVQIAGDEGSAITVVLSFLAGYFMPSDDAPQPKGT